MKVSFEIEVNYDRAWVEDGIELCSPLEYKEKIIEFLYEEIGDCNWVNLTVIDWSE